MTTTHTHRFTIHWTAAAVEGVSPADRANMNIDGLKETRTFASKTEAVRARDEFAQRVNVDQVSQIGLVQEIPATTTHEFTRGTLQLVLNALETHTEDLRKRGALGDGKVADLIEDARNRIIVEAKEQGTDVEFGQVW